MTTQVQSRAWRLRLRHLPISDLIPFCRRWLSLPEGFGGVFRSRLFPPLAHLLALPRSSPGR